MESSKVNVNPFSIELDDHDDDSWGWNNDEVNDLEELLGDEKKKENGLTRMDPHRSTYDPQDKRSLYMIGAFGLVIFLVVLTKKYSGTFEVGDSMNSTITQSSFNVGGSSTNKQPEEGNKGRDKSQNYYNSVSNDTLIQPTHETNDDQLEGENIEREKSQEYYNSILNLTISSGSPLSIMVEHSDAEKTDKLERKRENNETVNDGDIRLDDNYSEVEYNTESGSKSSQASLGSSFPTQDVTTVPSFAISLENHKNISVEEKSSSDGNETGIVGNKNEYEVEKDDETFSKDDNEKIVKVKPGSNGNKVKNREKEKHINNYNNKASDSEKGIPKGGFNEESDEIKHPSISPTLSDKLPTSRPLTNEPTIVLETVPLIKSDAGDNCGKKKIKAQQLSAENEKNNCNKNNKKKHKKESREKDKNSEDNGQRTGKKSQKKSQKKSHPKKGSPSIKENKKTSNKETHKKARIKKGDSKSMESKQNSDKKVLRDIKDEGSVTHSKEEGERGRN